MDQVVGTGSEKLEGIRENREGIGTADKLAGFVPDWVEQEEEREVILKLGKMVTNRIPYRLGFKKLTKYDPEYWGLSVLLTDEMAENYDIYYRVHAQSFGWLGWAKNGEAAGTAGLAKRLEAIQIVLVPKGENPPSALPINDNRAFIMR